MNVMAERPVHNLRWSTQLRVGSSSPDIVLIGDKIKLAPSILEALLSASTTTTVSNELVGGRSITFNPLNPYSIADELRTREMVVERHQNLPNPLTFRLVNPSNGHIAYAGIREFSAEEGEVVLSAFLSQALQVEIGSESNLTIHVEQLAKGTYARFRPLEAGYDPEDWKALLERHLRNTFTTLTLGEIITVVGGKDEYRFLIDKFMPEGDGICIVDTDLEVDIEPLNEEQARETLKRKTEKGRLEGRRTNDSSGGQISVGKDVDGRVRSGEYVDFVLQEWSPNNDLEILLESKGLQNLELFASPLTPRQRRLPREEEHTFGNMSPQSSKKIDIRRTNAEVEGASQIFISVHAYRGSSEESEPSNVENEPAIPFLVRVTSQITAREDQAPSTSVGNSDESQCKNCRQWIPTNTMMLHENFCFRHNVWCPHCTQVFKKNSPDWKQHWHCPEDEFFGSDSQSKSRHDFLFHSTRSCSDCGYLATNTPDLAHHRTSTCPEKQILCRFCHLWVSQQGPDDLTYGDPEVILSGLTPHEYSEGARTTECHLCGKITRLRDMANHLKHHDLERLHRIAPRVCRNVNCGRMVDGVGPKGEIKQPKAANNDLGLCDVCYGPLYNSAFDPDGKGLRRRVERKYLTQLLTGCGKNWCKNDFCRTGRTHKNLSVPTSKEAMTLLKPLLEDLTHLGTPLYLCTDEINQKRRSLAQFIAEQDVYSLPWTIAAVEVESGDLHRAMEWLGNWAPTQEESKQ